MVFRLLPRLLARPDEDLHAHRGADLRHLASDAAVAEDAEVLAAQRRADADLPLPRLHRRDVLRHLARRREDQRPGHLGRGVGRRTGVHVRADDDAVLRAGFDVDVRIDAALADELQVLQPLEERRADLGALADEHQRLGVLQPLGELVRVLEVVVPDLYVVLRKLRKDAQRADRVVVIVEDRDLHAHSTLIFAAWMMRPHLTISSASSACSASGVPPRISMICAASFARRSGFSSTAAVSR
jgi:hypothetical protein